jgi:UDP-glucose:(heptosyl)LPS alpha-1,3-glucosyltransferase
MSSDHLTIGFVRRGYSSSGGAETYLQRLARGVADAGHAVTLFTTALWPAAEWEFGEIMRLRGDSPLRFADELEQVRAGVGCDILMSLERVWRCDIYRAGDGVHRAWLERRAKLAKPLRRFADAVNPKHLATLRLEQSLFGRGGARRVIANSQMVQREITELYGYPAEKIDLVHNGVPVAAFRSATDQRDAARENLDLAPDEIAVLFVGSGWERKGLRFAIRAIEACGGHNMRLLVAGRGNEAPFRSDLVRFLGATRDIPALYAAADIFLLPTIYDPFSNASLEALAAGLPVITTRANGFAEIMRDGVDGTIIEAPDDVVALSKALRFWSDNAQREATRAQRCELATRYDISVNVTRTLEILLQLASAESTSSKIRKT